MSERRETGGKSSSSKDGGEGDVSRPGRRGRGGAGYGSDGEVSGRGRAGSDGAGGGGNRNGDRNSMVLVNYNDGAGSPLGGLGGAGGALNGGSPGGNATPAGGYPGANNGDVSMLQFGGGGGGKSAGGPGAAGAAGPAASSDEEKILAQLPMQLPQSLDDVFN